MDSPALALLNSNPSPFFDLSNTSISQEDQKAEDIFHAAEKFDGTRSLSPAIRFSPTDFDLHNWEKHSSQSQIKKVSDFIENNYRVDLLTFMDSDSPIKLSWMEFIKSFDNADVIDKKDRVNFYLCALFALSVDSGLENNEKIKKTAETLFELEIHKPIEDLPGSCLKLPPVMIIHILPYLPDDLQKNLVTNLSNPETFLLWVNTAHKYESAWTGETLKKLVDLLYEKQDQFAHYIAIHASSEVKKWLLDLRQPPLPAQNSTETLLAGESVASLEQLPPPHNYSERLTALSDILTVEIQETLHRFEQEDPVDLYDSLFQLPIDKIVRIIPYAQEHIQQNILQKNLPHKTFLLWIEAAFEDPDFDHNGFLNAFAFYVNPSFFPYFKNNASPEVKAWALTHCPHFYTAQNPPFSPFLCRC